MSLFGLETEYGISALGGQDGSDGGDDLQSMQLSNAVVRSWLELSGSGGGIGWDYETESPLADSRGFELSRREALAEQLTDVDSGLANTILTNGARLYVDHAHPEYAGPEVTSARDAVRWDAAGDLLMARAARAASQVLGRTLRLYKNNTDGKGASYGTHENYLVDRGVAFHRIVVQFTPFLASRSVLVGAGRVGIGQHSEEIGYQLSQRADFFEAEVGLETTVNRPIINTRDEPHADPRRHRRLHVITGDANCSQYATWIKVGTAALVLRLVASGRLSPVPVLADPVAAMRAISHDPGLTVRVELAEGGAITGLDLQQRYLDAVAAMLADEEHGAEDKHNAEEVELLEHWQHCLDTLRRDPFELADRLDWVAKLRLLEQYRSRDGLDWDAAKLALVDLQYADIDPDRGLQQALVARGRMRTLWTPAEVAAAITDPPPDTRAFFRGSCMARYPDQIVAASWDSVVFRLGPTRSWVRLPMADPWRGTRAHVADLLERSPDAASLLAALG